MTTGVQLDELRRASRYPKFRGILQPHRVGRMLNNLQGATVLDRLPDGDEATDPDDAWLLALADAARADYCGGNQDGSHPDRRATPITW